MGGYVGAAGQVGRDDQVGGIVHRVVGLGWFGTEHVGSGAGDLTLFEGSDQSGFVDQGTTGAVDEQRVVLHLAEGLVVEDAVVLGGGGGVERDDVGLAQQGVHVNHLDAIGVGVDLADVAVVRQDAVGSEAADGEGEVASDVTEAVDSDGATGDAAHLAPEFALGGGVVAPFAFVLDSDHFGYLAGHRE